MKDKLIRLVVLAGLILLFNFIFNGSIIGIIIGTVIGWDLVGMNK